MINNASFLFHDVLNNQPKWIGLVMIVCMHEERYIDEPERFPKDRCMWKQFIDCSFILHPVLKQHHVPAGHAWCHTFWTKHRKFKLSDHDLHLLIIVKLASIESFSFNIFDFYATHILGSFSLSLNICTKGFNIWPRWIRIEVEDRLIYYVLRIIYLLCILKIKSDCHISNGINWS